MLQPWNRTVDLRLVFRQLYALRNLCTHLFIDSSFIVCIIKFQIIIINFNIDNLKS